MPQYTLMKHQARAVKFLKRKDGIGALLMDPGTGKTGSALAWIDWLATKKTEVRVLVIAPLTAADTWVLQAPLFMDSVVKSRMLQGSTASILNQIKAARDWAQVPDTKIKSDHPGTLKTQVGGQRVTILSMSAGAVSSWCTTQPKRVQMIQAIRKYNPHVVVVDESHIIKSANANISKAMYQIGQVVPHRIILTGTVSPHALTLDSPVLTPKGWKPMGSIEVGDEVIGSNGKVTRVQGVWPQGITDVYEVRFSDGTYVECSGDHLWTVNSRGRKSRGLPPLTVKTTELDAPLDLPRSNGKTRPGASRSLFDKGGSARWFIPTVAPVEFPEIPLPVDPYLMGVLLGDGHLGHSVDFTTMDPEVVEWCRDALPRGLQLTATHRPEHSRASRYRITSGMRGGSFGKHTGPTPNILHLDLDLLGLRDLRSWEKFIPENYMQGSVEQRTDLLRGLMDSDGSVRGSTCKFTTTSPALAAGFSELVRSLGGYITERIENRPDQTFPQGHTSACRPQHVLLFSLPICPVRLPRKAAKWLPTRGKARSIVSVTKRADAETQCITVAADDGLFVTKDYIVTHNSPLDVYGQWRFLAPWTFSDQYDETYTKDPLKMTRAQKADVRPWTWARFRARYALLGGYQGKNVVGLSPSGLKELHARVAERSFVVNKEDALDLPPVVDIDIHVTLSPRENRAYNEMRDDLAAQMEDGSLLEAPNALAKIMKLRQITAGFARDTTTGETHVIGSAKRKAVKEVVETQLAGENRVVVFAYFRSECAMLADSLKSKGVTVELITGSTPASERLAIRRRFADVSGNPQRTILVAQARTMSLSVNELVTAQHAVFASMSERRDDWVQARGRLDRNGQTGTSVTFWNVFVPNTIDQVMIENHQSRGDLEKALLDHIKMTAHTRR